MKKAISLFLSVLMVFSLISGLDLSAGAEDGLIEVRTVADLYAVRNNLGGSYILMNDIDLTEVTAEGGDYDNNGRGWAPIGEKATVAFSGTFDGNGYSIIGMRIKNTQTKYSGLFGYVSGTVKNLWLEKVSITNPGDKYVGGICGYLASGAEVSRCFVSGTISGGERTGGLVGVSARGKIYECVNSADVSNGSSHYLYGAGGIIGQAEYVDIFSCVNIGNAINSCDDPEDLERTAGGICASSKNCTYRNCINIGSVKADYPSYALLGALVGYDKGSTFWGNYYLVGSANYFTSRYSDIEESATTCVALSAAQMKIESSLGLLDFENTWFIDLDSGVEHPQLKHNPETAEYISIATPATKLTYTHHDPLDVSGLTINFKRGDYTHQKEVTSEMISGYDAGILGEQTVTISYLGRQATYNVNVEPLEIAGISLNKTALSLDIGQSETLSVIYDPENATYKSVTWESDDETVATVDENGTVTAVKKGVATVSAMTENGKFASCDITVLKPVETLSLDSTATVAAGTGIRLNAVVNPSDTTDTLTWSSSNTSVAKVNQSGYVEGVASGTAVITLSTSRGMTASCTVTVTVPATSISFDEETYSVDLGQKITLAPQIKPANTTDGVTWSSSDTSVATVSRTGVVTGKANGTATITATTDSGLSATCVVRVFVPITSIYIDKTEATVGIGDTVPLTLTITPENTTDTISWSSSNRGIAAVSDGLVTAVAPGKAVITATTSRGEKLTCTVYVREATPEATVDLNRKVIKNLEPNSKYLIEGEEYSSDSTGRITIIKDWVDKTIEIQKYNEIPKCLSFYQELEIPHIHFSEVIPSVAATCTKAGWTEGSKCSICKDILKPQEKIDPLGHKEVKISGKPATCTESGLTDGVKCSVCKKILVSQTTIKALGHKEKTIPAKAATCTSTGLTAGKKCSVCGVILTAQKTVAKKAHTYDSGKVTKAATCTATGVKTFTCKVCGAKKTETIAKAGHKSVTIPAVAATCSKTGLTAGAKCSVCGVILTAQKTVAKKAHTFDSGKVTKAATCKATGAKTFTCKVCGAKKTEKIAKIAHNYINKVDSKYLKSKATCTEKAVYYKSCSMCGAKTKSTFTNGSALGHSFKKVTTKATLSKNGSIVDKCTRCSKVTGKTVIYYPKTIKISKTSFVYSGKAQKPSVTVKNSQGKKIGSENYTVKYSPGLKAVGKYAVRITFKGSKYSGSKKLTFKIIPEAPTGLKVSAKTVSSITLKWNKTPGASAYAVYLYKTESQKYVKKATVTTNSATVNGLKSDTNYKFVVKAGNKDLSIVSPVSSAVSGKTKKVVTTGISLNKSSATVNTGDSITLKATVKPSNSAEKVTWSSSNSSVARVSSSGVVTGVKAGTATITAKSGSKKASCKITVKKKPVAPSEANYDKLKSYIIKNGKTGSKGYKYIDQMDYYKGHEIYSMITYNPDENEIQFGQLTDVGFDALSFMYLSRSGSNVELGAGAERNSYGDIYDLYTTTSRSGITKSSSFDWAGTYDGDLISASNARNIADDGIHLAMLTWDEMIKSAIGVGLPGLGFSSFK